MRQSFSRFGLLSLLMVFIGSLASAQTFTPYAYTLTATLAGSNVVGPVETTGSGTAIAVLIGNELTVTGVYRDLSSPVRNSGFNGGVSIGVAAAGEEAGRPQRAEGPQSVRDVSPFMKPVHTGGTSGTFSAVYGLTDEQLQALGDDLFYVQISTDDNPDGELRGQLISETVDLGFNAEDMVGIWSHSGGSVTYSPDGTARDGGRTGNWTFENHILTWTTIQGGDCRPGDVDTYYVEGFRDGTRRSRNLAIQCVSAGGGWLDWRKIR